MYKKISTSHNAEDLEESCFFSNDWVDAQNSDTSLNSCTASCQGTFLNTVQFGFICLTETCKLSMNLGAGREEMYGSYLGVFVLVSVHLLTR